LRRHPLGIKKKRRRLTIPPRLPSSPSGDDLLSKVVNGIIATKPLYALLTIGAKQV